MSDIHYVLGTTVGIYVIVKIFRLIAGVSFTSWRQIAAAYLAAAFAATFIGATGAADGGPPNFDTAPLQWIAACIAAALDGTDLPHFGGSYRRTRVASRR